MDKEQRRRQSAQMIAEHKTRHLDNLKHATGQFIHGLFFWLGKPKPNHDKQRQPNHRR